MFRPLISIALVCVLAACSQQSAPVAQAQASDLDTPVALAAVEAPEGWVVRNDTVGKPAARVVVENGVKITELQPVQLVFVRDNQLAMEQTASRDL